MSFWAFPAKASHLQETLHFEAYNFRLANPISHLVKQSGGDGQHSCIMGCGFHKGRTLRTQVLHSREPEALLVVVASRVDHFQAD